MLTPPTHSKNVKFSTLVNRISGDGTDAWLTHYEAVAARERGEDVIILSVGDPDLDTPAAVVERAIERLRAGDTHYVVAAGRPALRAAIAQAHAARSGQAVGAENVVCFAGAQNALFVASMCLAGPGDEVITFEPLYPTYPATIEVSGARLVRAPATSACRPDLRALAALITPRTRAIFWATPNNPSGVILSEQELDLIATLVQRHELWVVSDEVYAGLALDPLQRAQDEGEVVPARLCEVVELVRVDVHAARRDLVQQRLPEVGAAAIDEAPTVSASNCMNWRKRPGPGFSFRHTGPD